MANDTAVAERTDRLRAAVHSPPLGPVPAIGIVPGAPAPAWLPALPVLVAALRHGLGTAFGLIARTRKDAFG